MHRSAVYMLKGLSSSRKRRDVTQGCTAGSARRAAKRARPRQELPMLKRKWLIGVAAVCPGRRCRCRRGYGVRRRSCCALAGQANAPFRSMSQGRAQAGSGAARCARHGDADRQRRHQGARRHQHRRRAFRATARRSRRAICCSPSMAAPSRPRSRRPKAPSRATRRNSMAPCATSRRYTDLVAKAATPTVNLDNAKTQADVYRAAIKSDQGLLENLKVQFSYCTITASITGRISAAAVKVGNFVRQADTTPMATINQMAPVYVSFTVPQKNLAGHPPGACQRNRDHRCHRSGLRQARQRAGHHDREHRSIRRPAWRCSAPRCRIRTRSSGRALWSRPN